MSRRLFPGDIVRLKSDTGSSSRQAIVERTFDDIDSQAPLPVEAPARRFERDPEIPDSQWKRFIRDGVPPKHSVLLQWENAVTMRLVPIAKLELIDRPLEVGELVKRSEKEAMSGTIIHTFTTCSLQPLYEVSYKQGPPLKALLIGGQNDPSNASIEVNEAKKPQLITNVPVQELARVDFLVDNDIVVYKEWLGRVEDVYNMVHVRLSDNCVVELPEDVSQHGDDLTSYPCIGDIIITKKGDLRRGNWIYGSYNANTPPVGTVVKVRTYAAHVGWTSSRLGAPVTEAPSPSLESADLESSDFQIYDRTRKPVPYDVSPAPGSTVSDLELDLTMATRVRFRDINAAREKYATPSNPDAIPRNDRQDNLGYDLNIFDVVCTQSHAAVQWQDLSVTTMPCVDLLPESAYDDEHAAWPGEVVHTLTFVPVPAMPGVQRPTRTGIVQSVDAVHRTANVRWSETSSVLYSTDVDEDSPDHGSSTLVSHSIPATHLSTVEETSLYDVEAPGGLNPVRGDTVLLTSARFTNAEVSLLRWFGHIVDRRLDGSLVVRLGAATPVEDVTIERHECVVLFNHLDKQLNEQWEDDDAMGEYDDMYEDDMYNDDEYFDGDDSASDVSLEDEAHVTYQDEFGEPMREEDVENEEWESEEDERDDVEMADAAPLADNERLDEREVAASSAIPPIRGHVQQDEDKAALDANTLGNAARSTYTILDGPVGPSHHFRDKPASASPKHIKRTHKEHKILQAKAALPDGVHVLTWESRLDLIRVLIIGPSETPYVDAPFIVDFYLPPEFPTSPPMAFFHSWRALESLGGIGRLGPNLYEDGRVCLSLLGTWDGDKSEAWNATGSTLLQVIVSLLGLVLVREPYYCEAGYESLVGTESSKIPSAIYSERVLLRARGCIISALDSLSGSPLPGLDGFQDTLRSLYYDDSGPRLLSGVIRNLEEVLERSDKGGVADGITIVSKGACIPLRRILDRLQRLEQQHPTALG